MVCSRGVRRLMIRPDSTQTRPVAAAAAAAVLIGALSASAAERELESEPPPSSTREIETPIQRTFPRVAYKEPLFRRVREQLQKLPPFFADTQLEARFRSYYLRKDRTSDVLSEAWAMGGSISYRSGWLADAFSVELEGFTSQPIVADEDRDGTILLEPVQEGYSALGIANGKLRYKGLVLTGYRQYLDLPFLNRQDNRMTPNTFESLTLAKPEGELRFSTGYTWKIKPRNSDDFVSMTEALGLDKKRGLAHGGAVWDPHEDFHIGAIAGVLPDVSAGVYTELGFVRNLADQIEARIDTQFSYRHSIGDELLADEPVKAWNLGIRSSSSWGGAVFRLGVSVTSPDGTVENHFGSNPSYVDLMQRAFNLPDEKALLASVSYDFAGIGVDGLTVIANFVASFDGKLETGRRDSQEIDVTIDYRIKQGFLESLWLRMRGSFLTDDEEHHDGTDFRVIVRYDFPVI
jgi:hypothetical protein